jgi:hypothetical protein
MKVKNRLSDQQRIKAIELYNSGVSGAEISRRLNNIVGGNDIMALIKRRGIKSGGSKTYSINESFFEKINSGDKAYFLGILYADGYNGEKNGQVELSLQKKDKEILEKLTKVIGSNKPLTFIKGKKHWKTGNLEQNSYRLYIKNMKMSRDLCNLGMRQKKSFTLTFPDESILPKEYLWDFIRGYFDGDGSICIKHNGQGISYGACSFISSPNFIKHLYKYLTDCGFDCNLDDSSKPMLVLVINKIQHIKNFYYKIYQNPNIYMKRKKEKFLELFKLKGVSLESTE